MLRQHCYCYCWNYRFGLEFLRVVVIYLCINMPIVVFPSLKGNYQFESIKFDLTLVSLKFTLEKWWIREKIEKNLCMRQIMLWRPSKVERRVVFLSLLNFSSMERISLHYSTSLYAVDPDSVFQTENHQMKQTIRKVRDFLKVRVIGLLLLQKLNWFRYQKSFHWKLSISMVVKALEDNQIVVLLSTNETEKTRIRKYQLSEVFIIHSIIVFLFALVLSFFFHSLFLTSKEYTIFVKDWKESCVTFQNFCRLKFWNRFWTKIFLKVRYILITFCF